MSSDSKIVSSHRPPAEDSLEIIERLDWQLWALVILVISVLGMGVLSFMFPTAFWLKEGFVLKAPERAFYGLLVLLGLTLAYMLKKHNDLREMQRRVAAERKAREEELIHNAFYDSMTNLPNRALLLDRLRVSLSQRKRRKDYQVALLFLDLDRFKLVNDSMGHRAGDQLLIEVGRRLQTCVRAGDTVARLGGDEFAILLDDIKEMNDIAHTIQRIRNELMAPLILDRREVFTSTSMGIALSATSYDLAEDLLRDADTAMYRAKARGSGQHEIFDVSMHERAVTLLTVESALRRGIEQKELVLHYQPVVWLSNGQVAGVEALVRWRHPSRGLLPPSEFIPIAEAAGLIGAITQSVLWQVCEQAQKWREQYPASWPLTFSLNLPAKYLTKDGNVREIVAAISQHGLPPQTIRLEIKETQLMENAASIQKAFLDLNDAGVRVCIDDFGTGFSSLSYLSTFQVDALKIDQSFVRTLKDDERNSAIVKSVNSLGHNLGIDVIAEGIETEAQLKELKSLKCQYGQGFYFSRPLDAETAGKAIPQWFPPERDKWSLASRLAAFELFAGLSQTELLEICQACEEINMPAGSILMHEGQVGDFAFLMEQGSVGIYNGRSADPDFFVILEAPNVVGEMAIVTPEGTRTASAKALTELRLLALAIVPCLSYVRRFPILKENLRKIVAERTLTRSALRNVV